MCLNNYYRAINTKDTNSLYKYKNGLFKKLNRNGFVILEMSKRTKDLIKIFGPKKIYEVLQKRKLWNRVVEKPSNEENKEDTYSEFRWSKFFIDINAIKEILSDDHPLINIILSLQNDLLQLYDIKNNENYAFAITILYSLKSSKDVQDFHTDFKGQEKTFQRNYPMSCIFALQDNTHFRYLCGSHIYDGLLFEDSINKKMIEKVITLSFGQFIIFHPYLIHSGWFFKYGNNLRIHIYIDDKTIFDRVKHTKEKYNETHFIDIESKRELFIECNNKVHNQMKGLLQMKSIKTNNNISKWNEANK